jgi:NAD-dependent SIR2 family protein deacetylase
MSKEHLFQLIRQENVILWAGAGLSRYAGYPTGAALKKTLLHNLKDPSKFGLNEFSDLDRVAQAIEDQSMNRNGLTRILTNIFDASPKKTTTHKQLFKIPHFRTIITTNYDRLFEQCYGNKIRVAIDNVDIQYLQEAKVELFKIHGCITRPASIIITHKDYTNFTKSYIDETNYWSVVKARIITRPILFLGYGLKDDNVNITIDRIMEAVGSHKRECYMVAPKLSEMEKIELIKKNIVYIDSTAEKFIKELTENIKENISFDLQLGKVSQELCAEFVKNYGIAVTSQIQKNMSVLSTFVPINQKPVINFRFTTDEKTSRELDQYIRTNSLDKLHLFGDKLKNFETTLNGIRISKEIDEFLMSPVPFEEFYADIRFENEDDLENVHFQIFRSNEEVVVKAKKVNLSVEIIASIAQVSLPETTATFKTNFEHAEICGSVKEEIDLHSFLVNFGGREEFKILREGKVEFTGKVTEPHKNLEHWKAILKHFQMLKKIERKFDISFSGIQYIITDQDVRHIQVIEKAMIGELFDSPWTEAISMQVTDKKKEDLEVLSNIKHNQSVVINSPKATLLKLHGKEINIGYLTYIVNDPFFDVDNLFFDDNGIECCKLSSTSKSRQVAFSDKYTGPPLVENNNIYINILTI